jgi:hypothetical protein
MKIETKKKHTNIIQEITDAIERDFALNNLRDKIERATDLSTQNEEG